MATHSLPFVFGITVWRNVKYLVKEARIPQIAVMHVLYLRGNNLQWLADEDHRCR